MAKGTSKFGFRPAGPTRRRARRLTAQHHPRKGKNFYSSATFTYGKDERKYQVLSEESCSHRNELFQLLSKQYGAGQGGQLKDSNGKAIPETTGWRGY